MLRPLVGIACGLVLSVSVSADEAPVREPVHPDGKALERAVLDTVRAYVDGDQAALEDSLHRIESGCRRISRDEASPYPGLMVTHDRAMHNALDAVRDRAHKGLVEDSIMEFKWILRGCYRCHEIARENGIAVASDREE